MLSMGREVACIKASFYIIAVSEMKCKGKNKKMIHGSGFARAAYRPLIEDESSGVNEKREMRNGDGGFAASTYGAMPESGIQVTSH